MENHESIPLDLLGQKEKYLPNTIVNAPRISQQLDWINRQIWHFRPNSVPLILWAFLHKPPHQPTNLVFVHGNTTHYCQDGFLTPHYNLEDLSLDFFSAT